MAELKAALAASPADPAAVVTGFATAAGEPPHAPHRAVIDRLFAHDRVEDILAAIAAEGTDWASAQRDLLLTKSPQSLKVTLRQLREGRRLTSFADNMALEYRLGVRGVQTRDFQEGVRAVIVDKDNAPKWSPTSVEAVDDAAIAALFAPLPTGDEWTPLPDLAEA